MTKGVKFINDGQRLIVFNEYTLSIFAVNGELAEILPLAVANKDFDFQSFAASNYSGEKLVEITEAMEKIEKLKLLKCYENIEIGSSEESLPIAEMSLPTIHDCTLRCKYCFAKSGANFSHICREMPEKVVNRAMEFLIYEFGKNAETYKISFVSGGEPFMNIDVIRQVHKISSEIRKQTGKRIDIWVCTNGTIYNDEIREFLIETEQQLGVSLDGPKDMHDGMRIFPDGSGSYDMVTRNIRRITSDTTLSAKTRRLWGLTVLTKSNLALKTILEHHKALGINDIQVKIARADRNAPWGIGEEDLDKFRIEYAALAEFIIENFKQGDWSYLWMLLNDTDYFGKLLRRLIIRLPVGYRCNAARLKIAVTANGDVYPCDSFVGVEGYCMGSVFSGIEEDVRARFINMNVLNRPVCRDCWARFLCGGDCYHNSYLRAASPEVPDPFMCSILKYLCELSIRTVDKLGRANPENFQLLRKSITVRRKLEPARIG